MKKVLIVDDNSANLYMLETLLKGYGFEVISAENGREALDKARLNPPDLIVTDILMPVMDGYALCREWKSDDALNRIPLVFYTATYTGSKNEDFALSLGAERFIIKPQEPDILINILKEVLEEDYAVKQVAAKPLEEEMEYFRQYNEILFNKLEKKMSDLKIANQDLGILAERYRLIFENATDVIYTIDNDLNMLSVSPSVERLLGYKPQDFIGRPVSDLGHIITPESFQQAIADIGLILKGETIPATIYQFIAKDGTIKYGEVSGSPLVREGKNIGMISVARDITDRKQAEKELKETLDSLRKAVGTTIQVMVSAVEARDPYTAGHQLRVANLSCTIATEIGLSQERVDGIHMAGIIHDIGKMSVPAEILSKPTRLSEIEFSLIKEHARRGYEIVKNIESSWPLAETVYQHHERMDGSGYPRNLKGEEIIMEARILAVADVVESMASHRPYRPALGIDAALKEIEKNSGTFYDKTVADACLKLFREKGFKLEKV
ncbi:MAG: HD domain-containing phosphohydrolase [Syntrophales bacterium]